MLTALARFRTIDRRIIISLVLAVLALPMLVHVPLTMYPFAATKQLKAAIDALPPEKLVVLAVDWEAGTKGECEPLTACMIDYLMRQNRPFMIFALIPQGPELTQVVAEKLAKKHGKSYGEAWINVGYRPNFDMTLIAMMNDLPGTLKTDINGKALSDYPMMQGIKSLRDVGMIYEVTGTGILTVYIQFCAGVPLAQGCTAVVGPEEYPYLQSGQLKGLLVGLGGAAQFEVVTGFKDEEGDIGGAGLRGMGSQSLGHLLVMVLILLGNLGVWADRRLTTPTPPQPPETPSETDRVTFEEPPAETPVPDEDEPATEPRDEDDDEPAAPDEGDES